MYGIGLVKHFHRSLDDVDTPTMPVYQAIPSDLLSARPFVVGDTPDQRFEKASSASSPVSSMIPAIASSSGAIPTNRAIRMMLTW